MTVELEKTTQDAACDAGKYNEAAKAISSAFSDSIKTFHDLVHVDGDISKFARDIVPGLKVKLTATSSWTIPANKALSVVALFLLIVGFLAGVVGVVTSLATEFDLYDFVLLTIGASSFFYIWKGGNRTYETLANRLLVETTSMTALAPLLCDETNLAGVCDNDARVNAKKILMAIKKGERPSDYDIIRLAEKLYFANENYQDNLSIREFDEEFCGTCEECDA